jgi:beta-lactamase regulating signal transducer with metallopeptidase domain
LHGLWFGLLAASLVALAFQIFPRLSHYARHHILLMVILLVAVVPFFITSLQYVVASQTTRRAQRNAVSTAASGVNVIHENAPPSSAESMVSQPMQAEPPAPYRSAWSVTLLHVVVAVRRLQPFLLGAWLVGVIALASFGALGARAVLRMCSEARPAPEAIERRTAVLSRRAKLRKPPRVLIHPHLFEPCLCGLFRAVILLPDMWFAECDGELLDAMLAHELAHARRLDHLVNLFQRSVECALFFSPGVHWLSRTLRRDREFCADALAVRLTKDPLGLAAALELVARLRLKTRPGPVFSSALGGQTVSLLPRIQELIGMKPTRSSSRVWPFAALPAGGFIALIAAACGLSPDQPSARAPDQRETHRSAVNQNLNAPENSPPERPLAITVGMPFGGEPVGPPPALRDRQISYEVRFMKLRTEPWRELLQDRLKLVQQEADVSAWIIDKPALTELLGLARSDALSDVLQAPKVTTFENDHALIGREDKQPYISRLEKLDTPAIQGFRPIVKELNIGWLADVAGSILTHGTHLAVDYHDSTLTAMHDLTRKERFGNQEIVGTYQVPSTIEHRCRVACDVPEESSLVISLGLQVNETPIFSGVTGVASKFLGSVGLSSHEAKNVTCERLAIITPRRIILEAEKPKTTGIKGGFDGRTR